MQPFSFSEMMLPTAGSNGPDRRFKATAERFEFRVLPGPFEHFSFPLVPFPVEFRPRQPSSALVSSRVALRVARYEWRSEWRYEWRYEWPRWIGPVWKSIKMTVSAVVRNCKWVSLVGSNQEVFVCFNAFLKI